MEKTIKQINSNELKQIDSNELKQIKSYALDDNDLKKILGNNINIIPYATLNDVDNIDNIFDKNGRVMILFATTSPNEGHWLCLHKKGDEIEYFDPYGNKVEEDKKWIEKDKLIELGEERPLLLNLLKGSGKKVFYNSYAFQQDKNNINTCGRHCATRLLFKKYNLDEYLNMIKKSKLTPDEFVAKYIFNIIKK